MKRSRNNNVVKVVVFILFVLVWLLLSISYAKAQTNVNMQVQNYNIQSPGATKLPGELSKSQIKWMTIGEIGYQTSTVMVVDEEGRCFLIGMLTIEPGNKDKEMKYGWIKIERKKDGYYVYVLKGEKTLWAREYISYKRDKLESHDLVPVKGIVIIKTQ